MRLGIQKSRIMPTSKLEKQLKIYFLLLLHRFLNWRQFLRFHTHIIRNLKNKIKFFHVVEAGTARIINNCHRLTFCKRETVVKIIIKFISVLES